MTPTKLPELLAALAERLPERVQYLPAEAMARVKLWGCWQRVYLDETGDIVTHAGASYLELSLREECDAREWEWELEGKAGKVVATVWNGAGGAEYCHLGITPSPAHALACAMVAALSGEEEG
ncbi:hypothetical protein [Deinococcus wulumuqiensis]|uniref:Phage ABA sandwich domain-containing protein n=1 Tax=Deinococcus wulumuqiensis TaxID=980427 RepID=A0AAV4KBP6_9DEIO|nr:hypothetical protein [Deinococcus wulumuqiensis]QII20087.1 hypothetical protein G6R31_04380 [Deinococcus wulumuqiensis R12]GGI95247.1 hypothetical protein GCM10010914_32170 [Deinococcus wulumuqiensis]GGP30023.1 hypothetical protein GCM10008021_16740 [Deinococcus wulumuqiensis]